MTGAARVRSAATSTRTTVHVQSEVPVPWARVLAPAVCAVIPRVLTNEEVQALKSWGMSLGLDKFSCAILSKSSLSADLL